MASFMKYIFICHEKHDNIDDHTREYVEAVKTSNAIKISAESNRAIPANMQFSSIDH